MRIRPTLSDYSYELESRASPLGNWHHTHSDVEIYTDSVAVLEVLNSPVDFFWELLDRPPAPVPHNPWDDDDSTLPDLVDLPDLETISSNFDLVEAPVGFDPAEWARLSLEERHQWYGDDLSFEERIWWHQWWYFPETLLDDFEEVLVYILLVEHDLWVKWLAVFESSLLDSLKRPHACTALVVYIPQDVEPVNSRNVRPRTGR